MAGGLKKQVEEIEATPSIQEEVVAPVAEAVQVIEESAPVAGHPSRDFTSK